MCEYEQLPLYKWYSSSDQTDALPGLVCTKLDAPAPSSALKTWYGFGKLLQLLESFPWE